MQRFIRAAVVAGLIAGASVVVPTLGAGAVEPATTDDVFISELHYDNAGVDTGEAIEIFGPAGTDLTGWTLALYNGVDSQRSVYNTRTLSGSIPNLDATGFGVVVETYPSNGIQNGAPDGIALVDDTGAVRQFLSYEGTFVAASGPAMGLESSDIGVFEPDDTPIGFSLQLAGDEACYGPLTWQSAAANSFGALGPITPGECTTTEPPPPPPVPDVRINEIHYDNTGTDVGEAVEIIGPAGTDLTGWEVVRYNGSNGQPYTSPSALNDLNGVVLGDQGDGLGVAVIEYAVNGLQNGSPDGLALVDPDGVVIEFLSYEGVMTAASGSAGGPAAGSTSVDIGVSQAGTEPIGTSLQRFLDGAWNPAGSVCASFGELNDPEAPATCPLPPQEVKIHAIQVGNVSPLVGQRVTVEGIVVGDHEGPSPALGGFFVQEEDADADADVSTSEGIFVFTGSADTASVGDLVEVEGTVEERFGNTQLGFAEVEVLASDQPLPTPATVTFPLADTGDLEWYEGMLATFTDTLVISEYFNYDRFGEIVVAKPVDGEERVMNPTAVFPPESPEAAERASLNDRSRITVDDGITSQNPENPIHPITRNPLTIDNLFRGGDTVSGLTGPVYFGFSLYRLLPYAQPYDGVAGFDEYVQTVAPAEPDAVGGDLRVASLNALNYFVTLDAPGQRGCGPTLSVDCRGANTVDELERQRVKLLNTLEGLDADVIGLNEVENSAGVEPLADLVDGLNERGIGTFDYVAAGDDSVVGSDAIKTGLIYRVDAVTPFGDPVVLDDDAFVNPFGEATPKNRAAVAQSFVDDATGEVFSVVVNHLKSKGSACADGSGSDLTGSCDATRLAAVEYLLDWIETDPTGGQDDDWLIIGDLNSYDKERPIRALVDAGWSDLIADYQGEFAYSFAFDGELGYLDYVMASPSMAPQVTGATEWHINADEPDVIDYDTTFKSAAQIATFDPTTPFRSSDHDPALAGISLDSGIEVTATPDELWPPNGKLREVVVTAGNGTSADFDVALLDVTSSDPDSGTFGGDRPGDIVIGDDGSLQLRAERAGRIGSRTYTIEVMASGDGQVRFAHTTVVVPHDRRGGPQRR